MSELIPGVAFRDRRVIQTEIRSEYDEWIPAQQFEWIDGTWTIGGMDPYEWADAMFGEE
jgi:hypothetical protein